ncbi:hypothetical protein [Legionella sp.]|uniref:hypothetical protein n=1 Tax=Legionella sp. TaxID=459 RepID=UPI003CA822D1
MQKQTDLLRSLQRLLFLLFINYSNISAAVETNQPPSKGNFSLPSSQQPAPFFSFGQNIINKNQLTVSFNPSYLYSLTQRITEETPSILYGITDSASLLITIPYALNYKNGTQNLSGMGDVPIDLEYAFYSHENSKYSDQATIIFSTTFPLSNLKEISKKNNPGQRISGFSRENAPSSFNAFSYFIGSTYARTLVDWYGFIAPGVLFIDEQHSIQQGTQYYYNMGIGHAINSKENKYLFLGLLELNGQYSDKTKLASHIVPNTGGSIIYLTPSLWFSTPKIIVQVGISLPVSQSWNGNQSDISYYTGGIITWTII